MILSRPRLSIPLIVGGVVAVYLALTAFLSHVAHAAGEVAPAPAPGWSVAEIMVIVGLVAAVFLGLAAVLHGIAAVIKAIAVHTATPVDDAVGDRIEDLADTLDRIAEALGGGRHPGPVDPGAGERATVAMAAVEVAK